MKRFDFGDRPYLVPVGVFDPAKHLSGLLVAEYLQHNPENWPGKRVLEIGTGCGLLAGVLHDSGAQVTATDISRWAVEAARGNLAQTSVDVLRGDLFEPVAGEHFDVLVTNPPYEVGRSLRPRYRSPDVLERLAVEWNNFADQLVMAFPVDSEDLLAEVGFELDLVDRLDSPGRQLGIWASR